MFRQQTDNCNGNTVTIYITICQCQDIFHGALVRITFLAGFNPTNIQHIIEDRLNPVHRFGIQIKHIRRFLYRIDGLVMWISCSRRTVRCTVSFYEDQSWTGCVHRIHNVDELLQMILGKYITDIFLSGFLGCKSTTCYTFDEIDDWIDY